MILFTELSPLSLDEEGIFEDSRATSNTQTIAKDHLATRSAYSASCEEKQTLGYVQIYERSSVFLNLDVRLREGYRCIFCKSIPRARAVMRALTLLSPRHRKMRINESSPSGAASGHRLGL